MRVSFDRKRILGRTDLLVGRLGISSSWKAPARAYEEAFERGCNYFTWGTVVKGRSPHLRTAVRNIIGSGKRDQLVLSLLTYAHNQYLVDHFLKTALKALGTDYIDVLLLGYYSRRPYQRMIDRASKLRQDGQIRFLGLTGHNRKLFPELAREGVFDLFHIRYNAAHRGAEKDVFPLLPGDDRPGIVAFTATRWRQLMDQKRMPPNEPAPSAVDCYRFVLTNPAVDVCMTGTRTLEQMRENLRVLETGPMNEDELARMIRIGDHLYGKKS